MATLSVYFEQRRVGTIDIDKNGPGFTYDPSWMGLKGAFPISITMPLRPERIASDTFLPWAANLLPESEQLRTLGQLLGMARGDVIGLLSNCPLEIDNIFFSERIDRQCDSWQIDSFAFAE